MARRSMDTPATKMERTAVMGLEFQHALINAQMMGEWGESSDDC
jgi:hypothetical protein